MFRNVRLPVTATSADSDSCSVASIGRPPPASIVTSRRSIAKFGSRYSTE